MAKRKTDIETTEGVIEEVSCVVPEPGRVPVSLPPPMHSVEWQDYVMGLFVEGEVNEKGMPYHKGLRRVAELAIGPIVSMDTQVVQGPGPENDYAVAATSRVGFASRELGRDVYFSGAADVIPGDGGNLETMFARFPTAMAETRARVRAFRNALRLDKVAAEECTDLPVVEREKPRGDAPTPAQVSGIEKNCRDLGIEPVRFINQHGSSYRDVRAMTREGAAKALKILNGYLQDPDSIPDAVRL